MALDSEKLLAAEQLLGDLENLEAQLQQLQDSVTRSHRLATLGTMASIIAHEFNNILTPVISYCELAQKSPDDQALARKAIEKALGGALRAAQISSSMLGFAREDEAAGACCVATVVTEVFNCLAREPKKDGIALHLEIAPEAWAAIPPVSLQQVLLNLVLNARQAMRRRGGQLQIMARRDDDIVQITVTDTGPGIPPDILPRLFEPFVTKRADGDSSKGTGLGLTVCRDLITRAGGTIHVDSSPGMGTSFRIKLPAAEPVS
jgi:two-component system NtrC family sensor kinase